MSEVNRRALLASVGGLAAVGIAGAAVAFPAGQPFSPEFVEYHQCMLAHVAFCDGPSAADPPFGSPEALTVEAEADRLCEARYAASVVIQHRPIRSWQDFVELALVVRYQLWDQGPDDTWDKHSINDELEEALQAATWWLIDGGAHG